MNFTFVLWTFSFISQRSTDSFVNMSSSGEDVAADVSGHMGAEEKEESVELLVCECYVEDREKEEVVFENEAVTKKEEEEAVTKEEDGDDTQSLDNETGSCYRGNATCRWNESMFDKNDSIYKVSMPQSFYELNSSTSKHDDNDTLSTKDKSKVENIAKVESWLSKESSNLYKRSKVMRAHLEIDEVLNIDSHETYENIIQKDIFEDTSVPLSEEGQLGKRKRCEDDQESNNSISKKRKQSPQGWLDLFSGWIPRFF